MANRRDVQRALNNRLELVKAGFTRRDLIKMGLMTSAGVLIPKDGLTHPSDGGDRCELGNSPRPAQVFVDPLPIPPQLPERPLSDPGLQFGKPPQECPYNVINPATGLPFEGRGQFNGKLRPGTDRFQFFNQYPPQTFFVQRMRANSNFRITSDTRIPLQTIWGFNLGGSEASDVATFPGPTIVTRYQQPWVVRRFNELPPQSQNGGFGVPEVSTHLHNFHNAPEAMVRAAGSSEDNILITTTRPSKRVSLPAIGRSATSTSRRALCGITTIASITRLRTPTKGWMGSTSSSTSLTMGMRLTPGASACPATRTSTSLSS